MTFVPVLPSTGYVGYRFLSRTLEDQQTAHARNPVLQRDTDYFAEKIGTITTAEELVADRRLRAVALGAFGLDDDVDNVFFVKKILEDGYSSSGALANRLADKRYLAFAQAFGFGEGILPRTGLSGFAEEITSAYLERQFEIDVGNQNQDMRLALGLERDMAEISGRSVSETTKWFAMMGTPPLRKVLEVALGLPTGFGAIDLDKQLETLQEKSAKEFGVESFADFTDPEVLDDLTRTFLIRSEAQNSQFTNSGASVALTLLASLA